MTQPIPIKIVPYDPTWPSQFKHEAARIESLTMLEVHHIGSTSIPGCSAKPIIDILGIVETFDDYASIKEALIAELGYASLGERGVPGRDLLTRHLAINFNISVFEKNDANVLNNFRFKERLIFDLEFRNRYVEKKEELAVIHSHDHRAYNLGKLQLIREALEN